MIRCLDIHTHHQAPRPEAVVSVIPFQFNPIEGQLYSVGIHPWDTEKEISPEYWIEFEKIARMSGVVAIGECGFDKLKGGPLFRQMIVMKRQIELSEKLRKPLIIHDVKAHDIIVGIKKDMNPSQKWLVHGLRGKPSVARMLTEAGIYISFGEKFNPDTPAVVPNHMILAETDDSNLTIMKIIEKLSNNLGRDIINQIARNTHNFLFVDQNAQSHEIYS